MLRAAMREVGATQASLARVSGVRQPSISGYLSGKTVISDDQLARLLACLGFRLEISRRAVKPRLTRNERRSWLLHCAVARKLTTSSLAQWRPTLESNCARLAERVSGEPHISNVQRWAELASSGDLPGLHRALTGLRRDDIEMREMSPFAGVLTESERLSAVSETAP